MMTNGKETDMTRLAPSILSADFSALGDQVSAAEAGGADLLHIDVMDGHFVPNISFGSAVMKSLNGKTGLQYDVHLMIEDPDRYIEDFVTGQTEYITVHQEACRHLHRTVQHIRSAGVKAGVAINPATPVESLSEIAEDTGLILIMSVPAPLILAPILFRKFATSTTCGSLATFSMIVTPSAIAAAIITLIVAPTLTTSK